jgi:hypothetical protein
MNSYDLSRAWFDFAFENPDKIKPIHTSIYFFAIEHCNRLGWKKKFGFPTSMVLEAIGVKSYSAYKKHFDEIAEFGFFIVHEYSRNQYSSNIIELSSNVKAHTKAHTKALDKALSKHGTKQLPKQDQSTVQSTVSIDKQETSNNEQGTNNNLISKKIPSIEEFLFYTSNIKEFKDKFESLKYSIQSKYEQWVENDWKDGHDKEIKNWKTKIKNTLPHLKPLNNFNNGTTTQPRRTLDDQVNDLTARVFGINTEQSTGTTSSGNGIEEADWSLSE